MNPQPDRLAGIVMVVASTAFFGLAGVFTKAATQADPWAIAGWRGFVGFLLVSVYVWWPRGQRRASQRLGWRGWVLAVFGAVCSILFISAFKFTQVANVAIAYATVPFMAAAIGYAALREQPRAATMVAALVCLAGVAVMVWGGLSADRLFGDALALTMTLGCAGYLVMVRAFKGTPAVWAGAISALMLVVVSFVATDPLAIPVRDMLLASAFGVAFAAGMILWTEGATRLPPAETGLLGSAEVVFAIAFAWVFPGELPAATGFVGGAIVLAAVFWHAGRDLATARRARTVAPAAPV